MGLSFNETSNYPTALAQGRVVFDGCNGQRFLVESTWTKEMIHVALGVALIKTGKRMKALEIHNVISINSD